MTSQKTLKDWLADRIDDGPVELLQIGDVVRADSPLSTMSRSHKFRDLEGKLGTIVRVTPHLGYVVQFADVGTALLLHGEVTMDGAMTLAERGRRTRRTTAM